MTGYITSDNAEIRKVLNEKNTVILVFANPSEQQIQPLYDSALKVIKTNNPTVWRVMWIKNPELVDAKLTKLFWPTGIKQGVVVSLGTGLNREVIASYAEGILKNGFDILKAFSYV